MYYAGLRQPRLDMQRPDIVRSLLELRAGLAKVPQKQPGNFLLGTWNVREFGGTKYDGRTTEALYCIAEIIDRFDVVAVQEVRPDLNELDEIMRLLGRDYDRIFTDVSYAQGGNSERLCFIWDRRRVRFTGLAGELVLPPSDSKEMSQIARSPFICGFQAGWARFNLSTVHIYYGSAKANEPRRVAEINAVAKLLAAKAKDYMRLSEKYKNYSPENLILLGDFNIFDKNDETFTALKDNDFILPAALAKGGLKGSNVSQDKFYDQIVFYKEVRDIENVGAGIFNFFDHVFRETEEDRFKKSGLLAAGTKFKEWHTYQMSDHLVMWAEFKVDKSDDYLRQLIA